MSFQAMTWAIGLQLPTRDKFVLLMLANYASNDDGECWPSLNRLCSDTSMTRNTVIDAIKTLEDAGALQVVRRTQSGVNLPNIYRLNLTWKGSAAIAPLVQELDGGSAAIAPEPINEPVNKKKEKAKRVREVVVENGRLTLEVADDVLASWRQAFPAIDVSLQIARAEAWLNANPANRKSNYERFLLNWLTRAQDGAPRVETPPPRAAGGRRPVHPSWTEHFQQPPMKETGDVFDVVATPVAR